ncbi:insulinase family protein [Candidatus Parcubacteria bacterium]|nr:insulinase family protein [Candidatus Parcubacteria bacterium]
MKYKKTTLKNGLRIITVPIKDNPAVTVLVMVEAGSNYETKEQNGLSHFLEHMMFKGTKKRPNPINIAREFDALGAQHNAFTGNEFTAYYAKGEFRHFEKLLDIVSDMYLNPTLPEAEMEKERGVIIQEILMYEDQPQSKVVEEFAKLLYGNAPAGRPIAGPVSNIKKFKKTDFDKYRDTHYTAKKTVVIVSGGINEAKARREVSRVFKDISKGKAVGKLPVKDKQKSPGLSVHWKKTDQTHVILGFRAFDTKDKRIPALSVLSGVLGRGASSRLYQKLRNELGACYYVSSHVDDYSDHGNFHISTGIDGKRIEEIVKVLLEECKRLTEEPVSERELEKAKEYLCGRMYLGLETSDALAEFYSIQETVKHSIKTPEKVEREVRSVTAEEVQEVAREIFQRKNLNLAVVGNVKNSARLRKLLVI